MERSKKEEQELSFLMEEYKKSPELFNQETYIDSPEFLETIGIYFENDENLPEGYFKLRPSDFIVEEILQDGSLEIASSGSFLHPEKKYSKGDPTIFATLVKCGVSTIEAIQELSFLLGIDPKKIQYAGIKDKDAITSQLVSIQGADIEKIQKISSQYFFLKNIHSGNAFLKAGSLKGNKFTVLIRTANSLDEKKFIERLENIKGNGFCNFYYSQRFASPRFINWFWGLLILKGEYKNAICSFLCSKGQREIPYFKKFREEIKENLDDWKKIKEILERLPLSMQNELKVVNHLIKNPHDFTGALNQIPEQIQLWVFAYASLLFNRKISEYAHSGKPAPEKLPLLISNDKNDWIPYYDFLAEDGIHYMPTKNLEPFKGIKIMKRDLKTVEQVQIHETKIIPEGVILSFSLNKGCYATTLLAHLFQLVSGKPSKEISDKIVDIKQAIGEERLAEIIEKLKGASVSKSENIFL
jgi:TruD family tRNA pseudouridine synthase